MVIYTGDDVNGDHPEDEDSFVSADDGGDSAIDNLSIDMSDGEDEGAATKAPETRWAGIQDAYASLYGDAGDVGGKFALAQFIATQEVPEVGAKKRAASLRRMKAEEAKCSAAMRSQLRQCFLASKKAFMNAELVWAGAGEAEGEGEGAEGEEAEEDEEALLAQAAGDVSLDEEIRQTNRPTPKWSNCKLFYDSLYPNIPIAGDDTFELAQYLVTGDYLNKKSNKKREAKLALVTRLAQAISPKTRAELSANYSACRQAFDADVAEKRIAEAEWRVTHHKLFRRSLLRRKARKINSLAAKQGSPAPAPAPAPASAQAKPKSSKAKATSTPALAPSLAHEWHELKRTVSMDVDAFAQDLNRKVASRLCNFYDIILARSNQEA